MNKKIIWTVILLMIIGGAIYFIFREPKDVVLEEENISLEEDENAANEEEDEEVTEPSDTDFSLFSNKEQVLGDETESVFEIESMDNEAKDGYHEISFILKSEDSTEPYVIAEYLAANGVIRIDFQSISKDSTGLGYQKEESINEQGVLKIYHNISAQSDQELYDIGVTEATIFRLTSESMEDGEWNVILQVKYPGEKTFDLDLGSENFSNELQRIEGIDSSKNATITSYTYSRPSGLMKLVWSVSGDGESPIPSVEASYNEDNDLIVTFDSLVLDRVANFSQNMTLPSGITGSAERIEGKSVYTFTGIGEKREFKLSASLSPNQVILEVN